MGNPTKLWRSICGVVVSGDKRDAANLNTSQLITSTSWDTRGVSLAKRTYESCSKARIVSYSAFLFTSISLSLDWISSPLK